MTMDILNDIDLIIAAANEQLPQPTMDYHAWLLSRNSASRNDRIKTIKPDEVAIGAAHIAKRIAGNRNLSCGSAYIGWRQSSAASYTSEGPTIIQEQCLYEQRDWWNTHRLKIDNRYLKVWNEEAVRTESWVRILAPVLKKLYPRLGLSDEGHLIVVAIDPVVATCHFSDWDSCIRQLDVFNSTVIILDVGKCLIEHLIRNHEAKDETQRHYLLLEVSPLREQMNQVVVMAYDETGNGPESIVNFVGGFAWDRTGPINVPVSVVSERTIQPIALKKDSNRRQIPNLHVTRNDTEIKKTKTDYIEPLRPISADFEDHLRRLPATFAYDYWSLSKSTKVVFCGKISSIIQVVLETEGTLSFLELVRACVGFDTQEVSLSDAVIFAKELNGNERFRKSLPTILTVKTRSPSTLGLPQVSDMDSLACLPLRYVDTRWGLVEDVGNPVSYAWAKRLPLDKQIEAIIHHFDDCTTLVIAEELLALNEKGLIPSAYFAAHLHRYLCSQPRLIRNI